MSSEHLVLRASLRASVLSALAANLRRERGTLALFESARVYLSREGDLPEEREQVVAAVAGRRTGRWGEPLEEPVDFFDAKGYLEEVLERCGARVELRAVDEYGLLHGRTAVLLAGSERVGVIGQVHPQVTARFGVEGPAFLFELDVERMLAAMRDQVRAEPSSRFPAVIQDLAVVVHASMPAAKVASVIESTALVTQARLFDVYTGAPLPPGKRSLAYAVSFQAPDRTLTEAEVADARRRLVRRLERELGAELRGSG